MIPAAPASASTWPSFSAFIVGLSGEKAAPGAQHAVDRRGALDGVREEDADAVAALDARRDQAAGDAVGQAVELAVADAAIARDDRGLVGRARGGRAQMVVERADRHG